ASSIHAKKLLVISEASADDLNRLFPWTKSRTVVARHGLPSDVRKRSDEIGISKHRTEGPTTFLFLDGANPRKRLDLALVALQKLGWNNLELVVTGNADAVRKRVMVILGALPANIRFVGRLERPDLLEAMACADILLYPSDFEGFGFPLIEAMAFGTSCVSFPGNAEKEVGGEYAIYTDEPDAVSLLKSIHVATERCWDLSWQKSLLKHALGFTWDDSIAIHRAELMNLIA
ncbi:MAG: glycosyltransferase, partial [Akkermansiaceae bacterium]|nr:glycosyltransferase [Akkermansiaceae bacterium]